MLPRNVWINRWVCSWVRQKYPHIEKSEPKDLWLKCCTRSFAKNPQFYLCNLFSDVCVPFLLFSHLPFLSGNNDSRSWKLWLLWWRGILWWWWCFTMERPNIQQLFLYFPLLWLSIIDQVIGVYATCFLEVSSDAFFSLYQPSEKCGVLNVTKITEHGKKVRWVAKTRPMLTLYRIIELVLNVKNVFFFLLLVECLSFTV